MLLNSMHVEDFRNYCLSKKGVTESLPFDENTLVFKVMGKMFALNGLNRLPPAVNLKCDPDKTVLLREEHDGNIIPGYHMNKVHWNTCLLEELPPELIKGLTDHSYDLVVSKLTKKAKTALASL